MAKAVHTMIRVLDEARSLDFYRTAFGLEIAERARLRELHARLPAAMPRRRFEVELTVNKGRTEPYDLGDGYGHLAFVVDDLDAEHERLDRGGLDPRKIVDFKNDGRLSRASSSSTTRTATRSR